MINLRCAAFERKRDVIQQVVGSASEVLSERSPYSGFTLWFSSAVRRNLSIPKPTASATRRAITSTMRTTQPPVQPNPQTPQLAQFAFY